MTVENKEHNDKYLVVGNPIKHSKSPAIHSMFANQTNQHISYKAACFPLNAFEDSVRDFIRASGMGMNVTVPFKQQAWEISDHLSDEASLAGAVNTLSFKNGKIYGDNTDGIGLVNDLVNNQGFSFKDKKILIIGAGGAVRGVLQPIISQGPLSITIANRTLSKAEDLANIFCKLFKIQVLSYQDINDSYDLIINGTSASLSKQLPPLPVSAINSNTRLYDMMYGVDVTVFNKWGLENGASQVSDGLGMLIEQAAQSFKIWRDVTPVTSNAIVKFRSMLET
jgi:shikimate dehydrogenase